MKPRIRVVRVLVSDPTALDRPVLRETTRILNALDIPSDTCHNQNLKLSHRRYRPWHTTTLLF